MVTANNTRLIDNVNAAEKLLEEVKAAANAPLAFEFEGSLRIMESPEGFTIQIMRRPEVTEQKHEQEKPVLITRRRKRGAQRQILNSTNIPEFKGFVLKNGLVTRRANVVMRAYGANPDGVPGREIIPWAKEHPEYAQEVMVDYNNQKINLSDFVAQIFN